MSLARLSVVGFALIVLLTAPVGAVSLVPLGFDPVTGDTTRVTTADWITIKSHRLNTTADRANGVFVNVTNFNDSTDKSGRIHARLLALDGTVIAAANETVYVQKKGKTARCELSFDALHPFSAFALVTITVDTTESVERPNAGCTSGGQGGPGGGPNR